MNPSSSSSLSSSPVEKFFVHHFNYNITQLEDDFKFYQEKYTEIIGFEPEFTSLKNNNNLYVKLQTKIQNVYTMEILDKLENFGMKLKLSSNQADQNSEFCLGLLAKITQLKKNYILKSLSKHHSNIKFLDTYVLPLKNENQQLISIKITMANQEMVNIAISNGLKIYDHSILITEISRAKTLGSHQCIKCFIFDHTSETCNAIAKCLHCAKEHLYKDCPNKSKHPTCGNCKGSHKSNSNKCPVRIKHLIVPIAKKDPEIIVIKNPESTYKKVSIPSNNPWFNQKKQKRPDANTTSSNMTVLNHKNKPVPRVAPTPIMTNETSLIQINTTTYSDCFNMALKFNNTFKAFV